MEITKEHKQVALIDIDIDRKCTRHCLHFNKLGKLLFSNKITQAIYSVLGNKLKQSTVMREKYEIQGGDSEADRTPTMDTIKLIQNYADRNREEKLNQDEDETTSDDKNDVGEFSQINNKVAVSQELECDGEKKWSLNCVNEDKTMIPEQTQEITNNNQSEDLDKIIETRRTSTRNKKTPSISGNYFFMVNKIYNLKNYTNTRKLTNSKNLFKIFHQNIIGLKSKVDELSNSPPPDYPHIMCLTEYHLKDYEIDSIPIDHFNTLRTGLLNCLNACFRGLNNVIQLLYCVSLKIFNKFTNFFCELKFSGNTHQRP